MSKTLREKLFEIAIRRPAVAENLRTAAPVTTNWKRVVAIDPEGYPITGYLHNRSTPRGKLLAQMVPLRNVNEYGGGSGKGHVVSVVSTAGGNEPYPRLPAPDPDLERVFDRIEPGDRIRLFPEGTAYRVTSVSPREVNFKTRSLAEGQIVTNQRTPGIVYFTQGSRTVPLRHLEIV